MDIPYYPILCIYNIYILYIFYIYIYIYIYILHIHCTKNHIFFCQTPWKDNLSKKKNTEIWYFLQTSWKDALSKKGRAATWSFLYHLERLYFFPEKMTSFPLAESERRPFSGNTWKYDIFCAHVRVLQTWSHAPLSKKIKYGPIPKKYT